MALDSQSKVRLGWIAAAAAPIVAVQAARLLGGGGPELAAAAAPITAPAVPLAGLSSAAAPALTAEQVRAMEWLAARRTSQGGTLRSPIDVTAPQVTAAPPAQAAPEEAPLPKLRLGGVASRGKDVVASINNRLFAVGDEPAETWRITAIDAHSRTVSLERADGKRIELTSTGLIELPGN